MTMKWIEEPCAVSAAAAAGVYEAGSLPVNMRPPFLRDFGGASPGITHGVPDTRGELGQPYANEVWEYRAYTADGYLYWADPNKRTLSHSNGVATLQQIAQSSLGSMTPYGEVTKVCGVYKTYYGAGARYCVTAFGLKVETTTPTWNGTQSCRPGSSLNQSGVCAGYPGVVLTPQVPVPRIRFAPSLAPVTFAPVPITQPPFVRALTFGPAPSPFARQTTVFTWVTGPHGRLGQTCDEIQTTIDGLNQQKTATQQVLNAINGALKNAMDAGDTAGAQNLGFQRDDAQQKLHDLETQIIQANALLAQCKAAGTALPGCQNDHPDCGAAGFICVNGDCVPGCRNDGDCSPNSRCVKNKPTDEFGECIGKAPGTSKSSAAGAGWGLAVLGLAAVAAIFMGRPGVGAGKPKLELAENPRRRHRRHRRRRAAA